MDDGQAMKRRRGWDEYVVAEAQRTLNTTPTPSAGVIAEHLEKVYAEEGVATPQERTVRNWIGSGKIFIERDDGPWSMESDGVSAEDAGRVLEVIGEIVGVQTSLRQMEPELARMAEGRARIHRPTVREGKYIARIRRAFPELGDRAGDLYLVYHLAVAAAAGRTGMVEQLLALTPWRDDGERLRGAHQSGLVGFDVLFDFAFETPTPKEKSHER